MSPPATAAAGHGPWPSRPTVRRYGAAVGTRLPKGPTARRRPARTPALHGTGAPDVRARQSRSAGVPTGHLPMLRRHPRRPPPMERRRPRRPSPQAGMVRGPPGPRFVGTVARSARNGPRERRCAAGRRGRRRSRGPALQTSGRASPRAPVSPPATSPGAPASSPATPHGAPASSPATAATGHGPWAFSP